MIIAFSGTKGSGKDTAAEALIKRHNFTRVSLADELKDIASVVFHLPRPWMDCPVKKEEVFESPIRIHKTNIEDLIDMLEGDKFIISKESTIALYAFVGKELKSIRELLQFLGTDMCRKHVDDEMWLIYFSRRIKDIKGNIVVTDARFKNERDFLKGLGATLILVMRGHLNTPATVSSTETHISETSTGSAAEYDVLVFNESDITQLQSEISMWYTVKGYADQGC